jgi:hypothetical protein
MGEKEYKIEDQRFYEGINGILLLTVLVGCGIVSSWRTVPEWGRAFGPVKLPYCS